MIITRGRLIPSASLYLMLAGFAMAQELAPEEPEPTTIPSPDEASKPPPKAVPAEQQPTTKFDQITVIGSDQQTRGSIASMTRGIITELNQLCNEKGRQMKIPLIIRLYGAPGDAEQKRSIVSDDILQIAGQYQLTIHAHLARGIDYEKLRYHVMEMLLYERGLGNGQAVEDGERILVKPWLVVGLLETLDLRAGRADRKLYQAKIPYFSIMSLEDVFDASENEWRTLAGRKSIAFRAISGGMISSLVRQPKGRPSMASYLADFATFKGEPENLMRKHFPSMNQSRNSLQKWVSLEMLELGTSRTSEVFSIFETEKRLSSILKLRYRDEEDVAKTVDITDYQEVIELKDVTKRVEAVAGARSEITRLSYRCFPTYRPLLGEYEMILRDIAKGKGKQISARLQKLADVRVKKEQAAKRVRDYLDWYYITQSDQVSGSFLQYRELSRALEKQSLSPKKNDSTENYLDRIQRFYGPGEEE